MLISRLATATGFRHELVFEARVLEDCVQPLPHTTGGLDLAVGEQLALQVQNVPRLDVGNRLGPQLGVDMVTQGLVDLIGVLRRPMCPGVRHPTLGNRLHRQRLPLGRRLAGCCRRLGDRELGLLLFRRDPALGEWIKAIRQLRPEPVPFVAGVLEAQVLAATEHDGPQPAVTPVMKLEGLGPRGVDHNEQ